MNKVVSDETWITMFKFDEVPRSLKDFQERCNEYQSKESGLLLSKKPMAIIKVKTNRRNKTNPFSILQKFSKTCVFCQR